MLLVSIRSSVPGRHTRAQASYGFQLDPQHPRLSCGYSSNTGRGSLGRRVVRTKSRRKATPKYASLFEMVTGYFTLATVVY